MKNGFINRWDDIPRQSAAGYIFRLQRRIFDAERRGDSATVSKLQLKLADSFYAKALAVRQVAQLSPGKKTAGIDGVKSPGPKMLLRMATGLSIHHRPSSVLRKWIPKPGKKELRPLGIPNLIDRAHQALLVIVLGPQWDARFGKRQYGFRPGRGAHDAMEFLRSHLRRREPEWVLELDIESFFDRIDHEELLRHLDAPSPVKGAVRRCLKAGVLDFVDHAATLDLPDEGTPQGGPLSPLLANIVLSELESHVEREFCRDFHGRIGKLGRPVIAIYADDAVVLHRDREVIEWARGVIQNYLAPWGLRLSPEKTRVSHTQLKTRPDEVAGFDFLGFHFQHVWTKKPGDRRVPYTLVTPSKSSVKRFYRKFVEIVDGVRLSRKQRGARQQLQASGRPDPVTVMIFRLNRLLRGWVNYFRHCNAKVAYARMDYLIHEKLWKWATRRFDRKTVGWIKENLFSGIALDKKGRPLLRQDGNPRKRDWVFKSPFVRKESPHRVLAKLADTPIINHGLVRPEKSFFDGDWSYWQARSRKRYPGTPLNLPIGAVRRQKGTCDRCGQPLNDGGRLTVLTVNRYRVIRHIDCKPMPSVPAIKNHVEGSSGASRSKPGARKRARRVSVEHAP